MAVTMRQWLGLPTLVLLGLASVYACAGNTQTDDDTRAGPGPTTSTGRGGAGGMGSGGSASGGQMMVMVPSPPNTPASTWSDVEPNDTPGQAVPVGELVTALWMGFTMPLSAINPETDVDYYVFRTGATVQVSLDLAVCYSFTGNLLDLYLYDVVDGFMGPEIASATATIGTCETLLTASQAMTTLQPNSVYLLEVRGAPGLQLMGDPGLYNA